MKEPIPSSSSASSALSFPLGLTCSHAPSRILKLPQTRPRRQQAACLSRSSRHRTTRPGEVTSERRKQRVERRALYQHLRHRIGEGHGSRARAGVCALQGTRTSGRS
ncbi:hypothetical protein FIBSPDRAFT_30617 [Athelia psychrophila]|uniref:Uncharacterized protein n=1 Tax=Athelia psychrophila TaxID=1759441 RepID=A0A166G256_9AGAM|nr:hypothetical protein FIBSPDRAFT_30617 [Fibularhizoctonia sp. CBS 109695]